MDTQAKIYIAGHTGLVGSAIHRKLDALGYRNLLFKSHQELDLINQTSVNDFFDKHRPDFVFLSAAMVGGIYANSTRAAEFIYNNLMIQNNIIHFSHLYNVKKLLFLGSSCIYPKMAKQPLKEEYLLTGELEPTNEPYAIAKIAGIKTCTSYYRQFGNEFVSVMPTNLYGPNDNYDLQESHVIPALIKKIHDAHINQKDDVEIWGTGKPRREFLYSDDLAEACLFLMQNHNREVIGEFINIGTGKDVTIQELASLIAEVIGYRGKFNYDNSKPDGTPRKILDISKMKSLGWESKTSLRSGLEMTYKDFLKSNP